MTRWAGRAGALHARPILVEHAVTRLDAVAPAIVLGRAQRIDAGAEERAAAAGVEIVRRRSGGSAVWVGPGECLWVDVVLARGQPGWHDDIGRAGCWMGDAWVAALGEAGVRDSVVHRSAMVRAPGSDAVCFAGRGPGEVFDHDGAKIVGISQRRTREWALFQCAVPLRWDPSALIAILGEGAEPAATAAVRAVAGEVTDDLVAALARKVQR